MNKEKNQIQKDKTYEILENLFKMNPKNIIIHEFTYLLKKNRNSQLKYQKILRILEFIKTI